MVEVWTDEEDELDDEEEVEEQVFNARCPHCQQPISLVIEPFVSEEDDEEL